MIVLRNNINEAIEVEKQNATSHWNKNRSGKKNVPCVFVQRCSKMKYSVGWRFIGLNATKVNDIQTDPHPTKYKEQKIVWVWQDNK